MSQTRIPFNKPTLAGKELEYIATAVERGWISGGGEFGARCEAALQTALGVHKVLLVTSGTHALEMAALLLNIQPGDEVIMPAFTFVSTANAFVVRGARPVFVDIRPDTLNLDEGRLEPLVTPRTRAIVPVHYMGVGCEMDAIAAVAAARAIPIVEDNAHGLFGQYRGRYLGTFGALAAQSFHETKNLQCGEGGALLVNDPRFVQRAEILREKGTDRARFFRGEVDKYTWVDVGSSYVLSDLLAAFLLAQLEERTAIQMRRRRIYERYDAALQPWAAQHGVVLPTVPAHCAPAYHMYYVRLPDLAARQRFIATLKAQDIHSVFHYVPLHTTPMGRRLGYAPGDCPVTEQVSDQLVRLPFYSGLTAEDQERVIDAVCAFRL